MSPYNSVVCGPKFTKFLSSNSEGDVVDQIFLGFAIRWSVPEIFAIKVASCQKSRRILDVFFALPNFRGDAIQDLYPFYHPWLAARRLEKVLWAYSHYLWSWCPDKSPHGQKPIGQKPIEHKPTGTKPHRVGQKPTVEPNYFPPKLR